MAFLLIHIYLSLGPSPGNYISKRICDVMNLILHMTIRASVILDLLAKYNNGKMSINPLKIWWKWTRWMGIHKHAEYWRGYIKISIRHYSAILGLDSFFPFFCFYLYCIHGISDVLVLVIYITFYMPFKTTLNNIVHILA